MTIWDCRTHVRMTSMTSSVERTDLDFKISVALLCTNGVLVKQVSTFCSLKLCASHDLKNVYSRGSGIDSFKKVSLKSDFIHIFFMILHMYIAPGQGQTNPWRQNFDVNRNILSLW